MAAAVPEERHQQVSLVKRANVGESLLTAPPIPHPPPYFHPLHMYEREATDAHLDALLKATVFNWSDLNI